MRRRCAITVAMLWVQRRAVCIGLNVGRAIKMPSLPCKNTLCKEREVLSTLKNAKFKMNTFKCPKPKPYQITVYNGYLNYLKRKNGKVIYRSWKA